MFGCIFFWVLLYYELLLFLYRYSMPCLSAGSSFYAFFLLVCFNSVEMTEVWSNDCIYFVVIIILFCAPKRNLLYVMSCRVPLSPCRNDKTLFLCSWYLCFVVSIGLCYIFRKWSCFIQSSSLSVACLALPSLDVYKLTLPLLLLYFITLPCFCSLVSGKNWRFQFSSSQDPFCPVNIAVLWPGQAVSSAHPRPLYVILPRHGTSSSCSTRYLPSFLIEPDTYLPC